MKETKASLQARIEELERQNKELLRLLGRSTDLHVAAGDLIIDIWERRATVRGSTVKLLPMELSVLTVLARKPGDMVSFQALREAVWGRDHPDDRRSLAVHISRLRTKLRDSGVVIVKHQRGGYSLAVSGGREVDDAD